MSKLISGKEALIALANGELVEWTHSTIDKWHSIPKRSAKLDYFLNDGLGWKFRLKPRTITINGIEVPWPVQKPELGKLYYTLVGNTQSGFSQSRWTNEDFTFPFGCWETLDEIQQVLEATQKAFGVQP